MKILKLTVFFAAAMLSACEKSNDTQAPIVESLRKEFGWEKAVNVIQISNGTIFEHEQDICVVVNDGKKTILTLLNSAQGASVNFDASQLGFTLHVSEDGTYQKLFLHDKSNGVVHIDKSGKGDFESRKLEL